MSIDTVDELVKLLIGLSVSFAIVGLAYQLARLIGKLTQGVEDFRGTIKSTSKLSDSLVNDYEGLKRNLKRFVSGATIAKSLSSVVSLFGSFGKNTKKSDEKDQKTSKKS